MIEMAPGIVGYAHSIVNPTPSNPFGFPGSPAHPRVGFSRLCSRSVCGLPPGASVCSECSRVDVVGMLASERRCGAGNEQAAHTGDGRHRQSSHHCAAVR